MQNLIKNKWIKYKAKNINVEFNNNSIKLKNESNSHGYIMLPKLFKIKKTFLRVLFKGKVEKGNSATFCIHNLKRELLGEITLNSDSVIDLKESNRVLITIKVLGNTEVIINNLEIEEKEEIMDYLLENLKNDILVISPSYPTLENRYLSGFVHSRLKAYKQSGIKFDLICAYDYKGCCKYNYEGIDVLRVSFIELRNILREKKYKKILVHFFDNNYANIFDASDLSDTLLYLWVHGPETLYWDWSKFVTGYFEKDMELTSEQINLFKNNDLMIKKYNEMSNVHWVFVSNWIKDRSEKLINIKFNNYSVIPNIINLDTFNYIEKSEEQRKKIFFIRRFDNCNKYAIDVNIRTILELSRKEFFNDLEFNIYGVGGYYKELIDPIKDFPNVHLHPEFLNHEQIAQVHKENGIGLFATRYDAQGVSMCEAAASGLAIIASDNEAIKEFLPSDVALICDTENYIDYANKIEILYKNPEKFKKISDACHKEIAQKCSFEMTVKKEIELIKKDIKEVKINKVKALKNAILTIIVPAYNVEKYIKKTLISLLSCKNSKALEIIVVNDGSKDNTVKVVKEIMTLYNDPQSPIIKLIDKENGGHGSTINVGIEKAQGKYLRIIDGDDWVNSESLDLLLNKLEKEDSDIVVTDYSEDLAFINKIEPKSLYNFMIPELQYNFDDVCLENYGFGEFGPILATANFKTKVIKETNFKLTEKSFYVDMEYDAYSIIKTKTISYYPLDIYRYFIGRSNQSVSQESFLKNYIQHEKILFNLLSFVENNTELTKVKKDYIYRNLINPMAKSHYIIVSEYSHNAKIFRDFDKKLRKYPRVYYHPLVRGRFLKLHSITKGLLLHFNPLIIKTYNTLFKRSK